MMVAIYGLQLMRALAGLPTKVTGGWRVVAEE